MIVVVVLLLLVLIMLLYSVVAVMSCCDVLLRVITDVCALLIQIQSNRTFVLFGETYIEFKTVNIYNCITIMIAPLNSFI